MQKHERLEQDTKRAITVIISEELKNPDVTGLISVTDVKITPDQKYAKVFVSIYNVKNKEYVLEGLKKSTKFIRGSISRHVKMRNTPELTFVLDNSLEYGSHMDEVFKNMARKSEST
ncbi:MAG: 30S ribosome-binding factor RbfA [Clostridia bacterium]|nr:30S ribosome-binding factor RbfA [Clostridia bacterium]MDD4386670.1 30S ribosome-binding factor RbfA [Clostridia bacterium]